MSVSTMRRSRASVVPLLSATVLIAIGCPRLTSFVGAPASTRLQKTAVSATELEMLEAEATDISEKVKAWEKTQMVDETGMMAESDFPIAPDELIMKAKIYLAYDSGVKKPELLSDKFEFVGPVVGPLSKDNFLKALGGFGFFDAFPDANAEWHHFRVDPFEPSRVWMTSRGKGTNTGEADSPLFAKPTNKAYVNPPQSCSVRFDADGKVNQYTIGYVMDRRIGNTGGLGGIYGIAYALGKPLPFPEAKPWSPSWQYRFFQKIGGFLQKLADKKKEKK